MISYRKDGENTRKMSKSCREFSRRRQKKVLSLVLCVAMMLSVMVVGAGAAFSDQSKIKNTEAVDACTALNIIGGYPDGSFKPEGNITRAEAVTLVNRTLDRHPDKSHFTKDMLVWPDNMDQTKWYYADMQEATNGHEYEWITEDGNKVENWIDLLDKDWNDRSVN